MRSRVCKQKRATYKSDATLADYRNRPASVFQPESCSGIQARISASPANFTSLSVILQQTSRCLNLDPVTRAWFASATLGSCLSRGSPPACRHPKLVPERMKPWEEQQPVAGVAPQLFHLPKDVQMYSYIFFTGGQDLPK